MTQFALSWDSYKNNICTGLSALQQNGEFVDMTLAADGHYVKVHQMVLSLASPYIKEIITSTQCTHPVIFLNKISYTTMCAILEYIYTGEVLVARENLNDLIAASKELHIKGLEDMRVDISAKSGTDVNATQIAGCNEGHQLATPAHRKEPDRTPISKAKLKTPQQNSTKILEQENEPYYSSDNNNADNTFDETMETESRSTEIVVDTPANKKPAKCESDSPTKDKPVTRVQYTLSNQGALQMILNRYMYGLDYTSKSDRSVKKWRCIEFRGKRCQASVTTQNEVIIKRQGAHNHLYHDLKILKKVRDKAVFSALADAQEHEFKKKKQR